MNILSLSIFLNIGLFFIIFFVFAKGGSYLIEKLKSQLPFFKGKYDWVAHFTKKGLVILKFCRILPGKMVKNKSGEITYLESTNHSIIDGTGVKDFTTIHSLDKKPLYITVEGNPTNVLLRKYDFTSDIVRIKEIIKIISKVKESKDEKKIDKLLGKLYIVISKLSDAFKYLPKAKTIVDNLLSLNHQYDNMSLDDKMVMLSNYKSTFILLYRTLQKRNNTLVNFTDYFHAGNLARIFNKIFLESQQNGRLQISKKQTTENNMFKITGVVFLIAMGILLFVTLSQNHKIEDLQNSISSINEKIDNLNIVPPNLQNGTIQTGTHINSNIKSNFNMENLKRDSNWHP